MTKPEKTKEYKALRSAMLESLEARGMVEEPYTDKVREYMNFWCQLKRLEADVAPVASPRRKVAT